MITFAEEKDYDKRITRLEKYRNAISNIQDSVFDEFELCEYSSPRKWDIDNEVGKMIYRALDYLLDDIDKEIEFIEGERDYVPPEEETQEAAS